MSKPTINRLIELQALMLQFRAVQRVVYFGDQPEKRENDVEHSYTLAMATWFLAQYFPKLDRDKALRYALAHDLVEIHAGDTDAFARDNSLHTKKEREQIALEQIKKDWSDWPELIENLVAYEERADAEAKFVYALDKIMPIMLVYLGKGHAWHRRKITLDMLHANKKDKVALSPEIEPYYQELYDLLQQNLHMFPSKSAKASQQR